MGGKKRPFTGWTSIPPHKDENIEQKVKYFVGIRAYRVTGHASRRMRMREVTVLEILQVLKQFKRDRRHDEFKEYDDGGNYIRRWSYAYKGRTIDKRALRLAVSVDETQEKPLLIITVIDLDI